MKFIHLGDLHLGKIVNGFNMLEDQRFALERIIETAKQHEVEAIVVAGDIYDKSTPSAEAVTLFDWFLSTVANEGVQILAIPGNHDSAERIAYAQGILENQGIHFPPLFNGTVYSCTLEDRYGPVRFWLLPFLKPALVRPYYPEEDIGQDYTKALSLVLDACDIDSSKRNVLIAHQFVTAYGQSTEREDSEISLGGLDNVDASIFSKFDYVALGHVHRPQQVGRATVRYSGSLLKYSFSEARYPKSAVLVELKEKAANACAGNCVEFQQIPYPVMHDVREIKGPIETLISPEITANGNVSDYLHVTLTDEQAILDPMSRLRTVYPNIMQLDYERRSGGASAQTPETAADAEDIDPFTLFEGFFEDQIGKPMSEAQTNIARNALENALGKEA